MTASRNKAYGLCQIRRETYEQCRVNGRGPFFGNRGPCQTVGTASSVFGVRCERVRRHCWVRLPRIFHTRCTRQQRLPAITLHMGGFRVKLSLHVALKVKAKSHGAKHHEVRTLCAGAIRYSTELRLSDISFGV